MLPGGLPVFGDLPGGGVMNHTVTLITPTGVQVVDGCYLEYAIHARYDTTGKTLQKPFLLILPPEYPVCIGDMVYDGSVGESASQIPANDPKLMEITYVKPVYLWGKLHHWEAGHKQGSWGG